MLYMLLCCQHTEKTVIQFDPMEVPIASYEGASIAPNAFITTIYTYHQAFMNFADTNAKMMCSGIHDSLIQVQGTLLRHQVHSSWSIHVEGAVNARGN